MLEMLLNPKKAERKPWEMFFIGLFYAALSVAFVNWVFARDAVLSKYSGILVVTFTVLFSMPFVYYTLRFEESKIIRSRGTISLLKEHQKAIYVFMWLFLGYVVALSIAYVVLPGTESFQAQIETYCAINKPYGFEECVSQYKIRDSSISGAVTTPSSISNSERFFLIFSNNVYVMVFTLLFSLLFGAGVIFILVWNASVIAAAVGIFAKSQIYALPMGFARYMIHGIPEIASYFIVALAGGIISVAVIRHEAGTEKFWEVLHDSIVLIILAVIVLFLAALIEVFITPVIF